MWSSITPPTSTTNVACREIFSRSQRDIAGFLDANQLNSSLVKSALHVTYEFAGTLPGNA